MARQHWAYQQAHVPASALIGLYDTDLINYKIWAEEVFGRCPREIEQAIRKEQHHVYLLCEPDLPWKPDPLRENPDDRQRLFERHRQEILRLNRPYEIVRGIGSQRFQNSETALKKLLQTRHT